MAPGNPRRQTRDFGSTSWKCWLPRFLEEVYRLGGVSSQGKDASHRWRSQCRLSAGGFAQFRGGGVRVGLRRGSVYAEVAFDPVSVVVNLSSQRHFLEISGRNTGERRGSLFPSGSISPCNSVFACSASQSMPRALGFQMRGLRRSRSTLPTPRQARAPARDLPGHSLNQQTGTPHADRERQTLFGAEARFGGSWEPGLTPVRSSVV